MSDYKNLHEFLTNFTKDKMKFDQNLIKSKSIGEWKIVEAGINNKKVSFLDSSHNYDFLHVFLKSLLLPNESYAFRSNFECIFLVDSNVKERVGTREFETFIFSFKSRKDEFDEEITRVKGKCNSKISMNKKIFLSSIEKYLSLIRESFGIGGTGKIDIKSPSYELDISIEDYDVDISLLTSEKIKEKNYLDAFNKTFLCNLKMIPGFCNWKVKIDKIKGGWKGKRHGKLVQEYGPLKGEKTVKEYNF